MSRRVCSAWKSAATFLQAGKSCSKPAETSISSLGLREGAQKGYMFSTLDSSMEQADLKRRKKATPLLKTQIQSLRSNKGTRKKAVKKLLNGFESGTPASMLGNDVADDTFQYLNTEGIFYSGEMSREKGNQDASYQEFLELQANSKENAIHEQSASMLGSDTDEASLHWPETEGNLSFEEIFSESANQDASDEEFLESLGQANNKDAIKKTAPLIEVLQQTASSSRRVHLSAWKGVKKDLSWDNTLLSIMPSSICGKQELIGGGDLSSSTLSASPEKEAVGDDTSSCGLAASPEIGKDSNRLLPSVLSIPTEIRKNVSDTCGDQYGVKLVARKRITILSQVPSKSLVATLKQTSTAFSDLQSKVRRVQLKDVPIHAILYFKSENGMRDALKLKTVAINGERLSLKAEFEEAAEGIILWDANSFEKTITIEDYPTEIPLCSVQMFFSVFGPLKIFNEKGVIIIQFENKCDKKKALMVHQFVVDGCQFQIRTDFSSNELGIRLVSKGVEADKEVAMKACSKYGVISYIDYDKAGELVAHYKNSEKERIKDILARLCQDKDLKGVWSPSVVCEGYKCCSGDIAADDMKMLLALTKKLANHVEKMTSNS